MRHFVFIILSLIYQVGVAQATPSFSRIFGADSSLTYGGISITSFGDTIYFSIFEQDVPETYQATSFIKTDPDGNQIAYSRFYRPSYVYSAGFAGSLHITSDSSLICAGWSGSLLSQGDSGMFFKFNSASLDTYFLKKYEHGNISGFYGCSQLNDGGYLFSGEAGDTSIQGSAPAWLVKTDSDGTELWQKTMSSDDYNGAYFTSSYSGGFYQLWATAHVNIQSTNPADSAIFVDKYTNAGMLIWRDTFGVIGHYNAAGPFTGLREGGGVIIINILDTTGSEYGPIVIYRFDTNGVILWQRYISHQTQFSSMIETSSGDIVACGWGGGYPVGVQGDTTKRLGGDIMKFDKDGNTIFFQVYEFDTTQDDILLDITETGDGGYACVGKAYQRVQPTTNYERTWLLKVDSNGCLNGDCPTLYSGIHAVPPPVDFFVFPSPASERYTVALGGPGDIDRYHDLTFALYDLSGRLAYSQSITQQTTPMSRGSLAEGLYIWALSDDSGPVTQGKIAFR